MPKTLDSMTTLQARALEVTEWLETLPRTFAAPVVVKIGRTVYAGATYTQVREVGEGCAAYASGERTYSQSAMYLLGRLPFAYRRSRKTAFRLPRGRFPWYVAGWYDHDDPNDYHPFGQMFQLMLDKHDVTRDDHGTPYRSVPMFLVG